MTTEWVSIGTIMLTACWWCRASLISGASLCLQDEPAVTAPSTAANHRTVSLAAQAISNAVLQIRKHTAIVSEAERSHHVSHLLHALVDLAEETSSWAAVLKLPFSAAEQDELAALLRDPHRASAAGKLPIMLLQRGRLAEALTAAANLPPGTLGSSLSSP